MEVCLNAADRRMLCKLPGVGGSTAEKLISLRPFPSWADVVQRAGLSEAQVAKMCHPHGRCIATLNFGAQFVEEPAEAELDTASEADAASEPSDDDEPVFQGVPGLEKHKDRWEKQRLCFLARFSAEAYHDETADRAAARTFYEPLAGQITFDRLSQVLQQRGRFGGRRAFLFPLMDRHPDGTLRCVYSGRMLSTTRGELLAKCNEEHCFPQSWQACKAHTGRDNHHIFATHSSVNGLRGNMPFGDAGDVVESGDWGEKRLYDENGIRQKFFLPAQNRGALARATLYVIVAYPGALDRTRMPLQSLEWLKRAATTEPVSLWERHRNAAAHIHQGVRNPFVDHPEWVRTIDFERGFAANAERKRRRAEM
eukprot:TRINITY_DN30632_c0_g2_i3.p1 TRINITY_DN30632_c0_g2~~TRINITY_DN30632_c0_g2_i3.p1  ORF type:complete len:391 (-),score=53.82 TRINITY_DN30632_c0_g2_i3:126-1229(-)